MGCDLLQRLVNSSQFIGFNPRTRMGCDSAKESKQCSLIGFNPRTRTGCDFRTDYFTSLLISFNPRTRMGCDRGGKRVCPGWLVSIHAPAWGATVYAVHKNMMFPCFNPRTRMGCDSTTLMLLLLMLSFNPRTRMGCDLSNKNSFTAKAGVSIHAPAWGATYGTKNQENSSLFQSTHPHGVRHVPTLGRLGKINVSIHAPAWGATEFVHDDDRRALFQSTHPHGVRRNNRSR